MIRKASIRRFLWRHFSLIHLMVYKNSINHIHKPFSLISKYSFFNYKKIIGTGTSLDTARLRYILSKEFKISPKNVHAYVIGEHGDSEFIAWSTASIGTINVAESLNDEKQQEIAI